MDNARPLNDNISVGQFVNQVLCIKCTDKNYEKIVSNIVKSELQLIGTKMKNTLISDRYRNYSYATDESRIVIREKIINELLELPRLENDDEIKLGHGGAIPSSLSINKDKQAYYIIGLPASGKSGIANKISDKYQAVILDSDYAKRKLPEFSNDYGASITHDESTLIVYGDSRYNEEPMMERCVKNGYNIVIPKIGSEYNKIRIFTNELIRQGYDVHIVLVRLDRHKSVYRAYKRFEQSKRYVPLSLIFDEYSNEPTISYYDLKNTSKKLFKSFEMISTDVGLGEAPIIMDCTSNCALTMLV